MDSKSIHTTTTDENRNEQFCVEKNFDSRICMRYDNTITTTTYTNPGIDDDRRLFSENRKHHTYPDEVHSTNSEAVGNIMFMSDNSTCLIYNNPSTEFLSKENTDVRNNSNSSSFSLPTRNFNEDMEVQLNLRENMERFSQNRCNSIIYSKDTKEIDTNKMLSSSNYPATGDKSTKLLTQTNSHSKINEKCNDNNNHIITSETFKVNTENNKLIKGTAFHMYKTKTCSADNFLTPIVNGNPMNNSKESSLGDNKRIYDANETFSNSNMNQNLKPQRFLPNRDIKFDRDYNYKKSHANEYFKQEEALNESKDSNISSTAVKTFSDTNVNTNVPKYGIQSENSAYSNESGNKMLTPIVLKNCPKSKWTAFSQAQANTVVESTSSVSYEPPQNSGSRHIISPKERRNNWTRQHLESNFSPIINPNQSTNNSWNSYNLNNKESTLGTKDSFSRNLSNKNPNEQNKLEIVSEKSNDSCKRLYTNKDTERLAIQHKNDTVDSTLYTNKKSEINRLHMEPPNFNKIKPMQLQLPQQHHSSYSSHGIPPTNKEAVTPQQFAEMRQKYNYISDLRLKNPTNLGDSKVETTNSKLYVRAPNFSTQNFQKPERPPPFADGYYTNNNQITTNSNATKRSDQIRPKDITSQYPQFGNDVEFSVVQQKSNKFNYATHMKTDNFDLAEITVPTNNEDSWTTNKTMQLKPVSNIQYAADSYSNKSQQRVQISPNMKQSQMPYDSLTSPMIYASNHNHTKYPFNGSSVPPPPFKSEPRIFNEPINQNMKECHLVNQVPMERFNKSSVNYASNVINSSDNGISNSVSPISGLVDPKQQKPQISRRLISPVTSSNTASPIYRNYQQPGTPTPRQIPASSNFSHLPTYYPHDEPIGNTASQNTESRLNKPNGSYYKINSRSSQDVLLHKSFPPAIPKRDNEYQKEQPILQKSISPCHSKVTVKPNYREMISHACAVRNATSENDLNLQIIKRTLNCDIPVIRKSENDLSKNIFDSPEPNKFPMKVLSTSSSEADLTRYSDKNFYENPNSISNSSYNDITSSRNKTNLRNNVNEIAVSIQPMNKCDSIYHENNKMSSVVSNAPPITKPNMPCKNINNNIEENKRRVSYDNETFNPLSSTPPSIACSKKTNSFSPLDLSVKTVKTIADSTGCSEINQNNYYNRPKLTNSSSNSVPKVDFTPNFLKHTTGTGGTFNECNDLSRQQNQNQNQNKSIKPPTAINNDISKMCYALPESSSSVIKTNSHGNSNQYRNESVTSPSSSSSTNPNIQTNQYYSKFGHPSSLIRKETFSGQKYESNVINNNVPSNTLAPFCPSSSTSSSNYMSSGKGPHSPNIPNRYLNNSPQLPTPTKYGINSTNIYNSKWLNDTRQDILPHTPPLIMDTNSNSNSKIQNQTNQNSSKFFKQPPPHLKTNSTNNSNNPIINQQNYIENSEQKMNCPNNNQLICNAIKKRHWKVLEQSEKSYQSSDKVRRIDDDSINRNNFNELLNTRTNNNQSVPLKIQVNPQYNDVIHYSPHGEKFENLKSFEYNQQNEIDNNLKTTIVQKLNNQLKQIVIPPPTSPQLSNNTVNIPNLNSDLKISTVISHANAHTPNKQTFPPPPAPPPLPQNFVENQYRGVNKSVISKLRTSIEMKEQAKQQLNIKNQSLYNKPRQTELLETQKPDITSILAARIRTKGELKGFVSVDHIEKPTILNDNNKPEPTSSNINNVAAAAATEPTNLNTNSVENFRNEIEELTKKKIDDDQISDTDKSKSSFDLMDWGSACNDFVDQLLGNPKKRGKKRNNFKLPNSSTEDMPTMNKNLDNLPGFACNLDIDIKLIEKIKKESEDLINRRRYSTNDNDKGSSSSEENKPLQFLRQKSIISEDIPSMSDPVLKFSSPGQSATNHASSYKRHKFNFHKSFDVASDKVAKTLRERYRLEQEKRFAARLSRSSSSESDNELNKRNTQRPRKQHRKRRMSTKRIIETDSSGIEDISMVRNLERSREEYHRRQKQHIVSIKPDPDAQIGHIETIEQNQLKNQSNNLEDNCTAVKEEQIDKYIKLKEDCLAKLNEDDDKKETNVKKEENHDLSESRKMKTPSKSVSTFESRNEETMTRSKRKRELEMQIANAKVLRNEKIVRNVNFNKKKSNYKSDDTGSQVKNKYRNQDVGKRKEIENDNDDICSKKQKMINPSNQRERRLNQHSSNESNKESDNEKVKTRLRSRRLQESNNEPNASGVTNKDRKSNNCKLNVKSRKKDNNTPSKTSKIITNNSETDKYPPGWELDLYQYKRSLKIPARLITIKGSTKHRVSTSLPDLDPHTSDASENYSINRKTNQKGGYSKNYNINKNVETFVPDEPKSIIDVLHSRVLKTKRLNKKLIRNMTNESKIIYNSSKDAELLPTPTKDDDKLTNATGHHNVFEPQILNTRTRTESKNLKHKEIIREVFGGEDRPASAPPDMRDVDIDIKSEKISFVEKYEQYLETMNIDFGQKIIRKNRNNQENNNQTINSVEENSNSYYDFKNNGTVIKVEPDINLHQNDEETLDTDIASSQIDDLKDIDNADGQDTPSINSERDSMVTPVLFQQRKKAGRSRYSRKKGSSGFDYIRKKKKPPANSGSNIRGHWLKKITPEIYDLQQPKDENDVSKEIQKWVLNKSVGQSALHKAARLGYIDVIAYCLEKMNLNPDPKDNAGYTPLHEACAKGRLDIARILLQYGANHSETAHSGIRPLHEASENGYIEIVRLLLSFGADPLLTTYSGQTPLALAENLEMEQFIKNYLFDVQNTGPHKQPWRFLGPWKIEDPDTCGYDVLYGAPETETRLVSKFSETPASSTTSLMDNTKTTIKIKKEPIEDEDKSILTNQCQVILDNIDHFDSVKLYKDYHRNKSKDQKDPEFAVSSSDGDGAIYEFEESEAPLPPLYVFKDEGKVKWLLLSDLCNLLKVKSKDTLLKQIYASTPASLTVDKDIFRELKLTEFLERATCLQLLCAGEKLNIFSSKVMLVKYNESVRNLLGVETVLMQF